MVLNNFILCSWNLAVAGVFSFWTDSSRRFGISLLVLTALVSQAFFDFSRTDSRAIYCILKAHIEFFSKLVKIPQIPSRAPGSSKAHRQPSKARPAYYGPSGAPDAPAAKLICPAQVGINLYFIYFHNITHILLIFFEPFSADIY